MSESKPPPSQGRFKYHLELNSAQLRVAYEALTGYREAQDDGSPQEAVAAELLAMFPNRSALLGIKIEPTEPIEPDEPPPAPQRLHPAGEEDGDGDGGSGPSAA